jgi:hypothetical protein
MSDARGLTSLATVTITIQGANDAPHDIVGGPFSFEENLANGMSIGTVTGQDVDSVANGEVFT